MNAGGGPQAILFQSVTSSGSASRPSACLSQFSFAVDLASDGTGTSNCWAHNVAGTQFPAVLPGC